ncbi:GntR family transcriptional regulator [Saccharopolyspora sp. WRP15-2]|uniref:GntR family transcriptional regulator n=1 Tax=Saccharopolyspora oryzae TaxID=2997343 RepID=A0ABT4UQR4_9PSEU|nr:GntR family transcriptional regulator [Saccharopolyspora oryzae]MDA3624065.1 GntR family transcriptional regulator [Saccharopolyspora oryzae]
MADHSNPLRGSGTRRKQLPEEVASYVRELIMTGQARPGEFLRMEPIAEALGVSNTPVREGLLALRSEGFVQLVPRRGFVVAQVSRQDVHDMFWTQAQFAGELAARAARRITPEELAGLVEINEAFNEAVEAGDHDRITSLGHDFHRAINLAADSRRLTLLFGAVVNHLPNRFYTSLEGRVATTSHDHPELIEALRDHDPERARSIAENHILVGADGVIKMIEERALWAVPDETR